MSSPEPNVAETSSARSEPEPARKSILIYSPDLSICFSLSSFLQDRFNVLTTSDPELLRSLATIQSTALVIIDDEPSSAMIERLRQLRKDTQDLPLLMFYVYGPGNLQLDKSAREHVNTVFYKPINVHEITSKIEELIGN